MAQNHLWRICPKTGRRFFSPSGPWCLWLLPIIGLASLIWFIIRVTPKPSRMAYPCQRIAAPLATSFVLWLVGIMTSALAFRKARVMLVRSRAVLATVCLLVGLIGVWVAVTNTQDQPASAASAFVPSDAANTPMGTAKGINPGRVTWAHDPDSTSWVVSGSTRWYEDAYTDQTVVNTMISDSLQLLTSESTDADAWDALFRHLNVTKDSEDVGYVSGDKIAIKINQVQAWNDYSWYGSTPTTSPQVLYAVLSQLINAGVPAADIIVFETSRVITNTIQTKCSPLGVRFGDRKGTGSVILAVHDSAAPISFSNHPVNDPLTLLNASKTAQVVYNGPYYPATFVTEAKYFINLSDMKGHTLTGVTLAGKNLFGTVYNPMTHASNSGTVGWSPGENGLHTFVKTMSISTLVSGEPERVYGQYNAFVDLMGFEHFGGKTVLYISTALYIGKNFDQVPNKWDTLGNDWPSSIFMSQDPVAIDSVSLDFMRNEPTLLMGGLHVVRGDTDNYLHEAAQAGSPPSGTLYDPNNDGTGLSSLGAHEHWNNATDRRYSRNLGTGAGIELLQVGVDTGDNNQVIGQQIFYNNSGWDGNDPAAGASDDAAIATNKFALLPTETASFPNYTSYSKGINGIMVDVSFSSHTPTVSDFTFKVGNDSIPSGWPTAPAPTSVTVRTGAGASGSDRVTIIWADNAIENEWLEVTCVLTGDVFYYGNAIGETGDSVTDAEVTPTDEIYVRNNPATLAVSSASISHAADFNRDKKVGPTDMVLCRNNGTNSSTALQLIELVINTAPTVTVGSDTSITLPTTTFALTGSVSDDGYPSAGTLTTTWSKTSGPGVVTFANASAVDTTATFPSAGIFTLRLTADDGDLSNYDDITITVNSAGTGPFIESGGMVVMECENYHDEDDNGDNAGGWFEANSISGYVGSGYMDTGEGWTEAWSGGARMDYDITFTTPGTYSIWIHRYAEDDTRNSCYVGMDGTQTGSSEFDNTSPTATWGWHKHTTDVTVSAGSHTFNIRRRERKFRVDRIILTTDSGFTPSGTGPAESAR